MKVVVVAFVALGVTVLPAGRARSLRRPASPGAGGRLEACGGVAPACAPLRAGSAPTLTGLAGARVEPPGDAGRRRGALPVRFSGPSGTSESEPNTAAGEQVLDGCDDPERWHASPSDGVSLAITEVPGLDGGALRLAFDYHGGAGWAAARRPIDLALPENWELSFWLRGETPPENLEIKLVSAAEGGGENVWWVNRRNFEFPREWTRIKVKKRQLEFAWGPAGGGEPTHLSAIELAITSGSGGAGSVWIDRLALRALPPEHPYAGTPVASASSSADGRGAAMALDGDPRTTWRSAAGDAAPWLAIDFGEEREYGGLVVDRGAGGGRAEYAVELSDDGKAWRTVRTVHGGAAAATTWRSPSPSRASCACGRWGSRWRVDSP